MKKSFRYSVIILLALILGLGVVPASSRIAVPATQNLRKIVVVVYETDKGLRLKLQSGIYKDTENKKYDANYYLADLKLQEGEDCQLIEVVDDRAPLSAITEVSEMAINAGFKDIRPFIYWHKTGRMAQVEFGAPIKFTTDAEKIGQLLEKEQ
jgi:hypothetical protein